MIGPRVPEAETPVHTYFHYINDDVCKVNMFVIFNATPKENWKSNARRNNTTTWIPGCVLYKTYYSIYSQIAVKADPED
jgi:hypothetical protein